MKIEDIAIICHEANKAYCESLGDDSQYNWTLAPKWQHEATIEGVKFRLKNRNGTSEEQHQDWLRIKKEDGWSYGIVKDVDKKQHPRFLSWDNLPEFQKVKDVLFISIVDGLKEFLE